MVRSAMSQAGALGGEGRAARGSALRRRTARGTSPHSRDRISDLPDDVAHHIMSFLPTKDVVRTTVWSKRWQAIWWAFPVHDFDESRFQNGEGTGDRAELIGAMIDRCIRENGQNPTVQKLRVHAIHPNDIFVQGYTKNYIEFGITESKLLDLDITFDSKYCYAHAETYPSAFLFPNMAFTSGTFLTSLKLQACNCGPCEDFFLPSLEKISLKYVCIDDKTLELLISNSPILKELNIEYCFDINVLRVLNPSLTTLGIANSEDLSLLEMDVPKLCFFSYNGAFTMINHPAVGIEDQCSEILQFKSPKGPKAFNKLKTALISNLKMTDETSEKMFSSFKSLENVRLMCCAFATVPLATNARLASVNIDCCEFESLRISRESLRTFSFSSNALVNSPIMEAELPGSSFLRVVRSISLGGSIQFPDGCFDFSAGPLLETLALRSCPGLKTIKLWSPKLKKLVIELCLELESGFIITPELKNFQYTGFVMVDFLPVNISDDATVDLNLLKPNRMCLNNWLYGHNLWSFLRLFHYARVLRIQSDYAAQCIIPYRLNYGPAIRFLDELNVKTFLRGRSYLECLLQALDISFCFKTVTLNIWTSEIELKFFVLDNLEHILKNRLKQDEISEKHDCVGRHLAEANLKNFEGNHSEMEVVAYLLGNATKLKTITVCFKSGLPVRDAEAIAGTINGFPIASRNPVTFNFFLPQPN